MLTRDRMEDASGCFCSLGARVNKRLESPAYPPQGDWRPHTHTNKTSHIMLWRRTSERRHRRASSCSSSSLGPSSPSTPLTMSLSSAEDIRGSTSSPFEYSMGSSKGYVHSPTSNLAARGTARPVLESRQNRAHRSSFHSTQDTQHSKLYPACASQHQCCRLPTHINRSFQAASVSVAKMSVREDREEEQCPVCLCELSLKLQGEKPHVVPVCLHRLRKSLSTVSVLKMAPADLCIRCI